MYVMRRGLGDTVVTDPVTGEQKVVTSSPITSADVYATGAAVYKDSFGNVIGTDVGGQTGPFAPGGFTPWINANSGLVIGIGAGLLALMFVARAGR